MNPRAQVDPAIRLTLISICTGLFVGALCTYFGTGNFVTDITAAICTTILTLQIAKLWYHRQLSPQITSLTRALSDPTLFARIDEQLDLWEGISGLKKRHPVCIDFYLEKEAELFTKLIAELRVLSKGDVKIESERRELTSNHDFLLKLPKKTVCAISYQDESFWDEEAGKKFLDAHTVAINNHVKVTRVFILTKAAILTQRGIIQYQIGLGIDCQIIDESILDARFKEDFVIYDDKYVRHARLVAETPEVTLKTATLTCDADTLSRYREQFDYLRLRATNANDYYSKKAWVI